MAYALIQVDAFTDTPFAGNPAAVCILSAVPQQAAPDGAAHDAAWMQHVATEMNLSETAFVQRRADGFDLRWFTPTDEVDLCGHATLASAHVLWTEGFLAPNEPARFHTKSGVLTARMEGEWIVMDFPADPAQPVEAPPSLLDALGLTDPVFVGRGDRDYLIVVDEAQTVYDLAPDMRLLATVETRGVTVTAEATGEVSRSGDDNPDFVSRFFAPRYGVPEDPVTGSAHCSLAPYWTEQLGRSTLVGRQASARQGTVRVRMERPGAERVELAGQAVTVLQARLTTDA